MMMLVGAVALAAGVAFAAEKEDPIWALEPRTPWLTPVREVMNLGGPGSEWRATYTKAIQGEYLRMADKNKVYHWTFEPVDEAQAKWTPVRLPQTSYSSPANRYTQLNVGYFERKVTLTEEQAARNVRICFESIGIHYKVWVNGRLAVDEPQSSTFLERHDISAFVKPGENTLRIMIGDKRGEDNSWVDWPLNECKLGIMRPFYLEFRDKVAIEKVAVRTQVTPEKVMTVRVCVTNMLSVAYKGALTAKVKVNSGVSILLLS